MEQCAGSTTGDDWSGILLALSISTGLSFPGPAHDAFVWQCFSLRTSQAVDINTLVSDGPANAQRGINLHCARFKVKPIFGSNSRTESKYLVSGNSLVQRASVA